MPRDDETLPVLTRHRKAQAEERLAAKPKWDHHDLIVATHAGRSVKPRSLDRALELLIEAAGIPRYIPRPPPHGSNAHGAMHSRNWRAPSRRRPARPLTGHAHEYLRPCDAGKHDGGRRSDRGNSQRTGRRIVDSCTHLSAKNARGTKRQWYITGHDQWCLLWTHKRRSGAIPAARRPDVLVQMICARVLGRSAYSQSARIEASIRQICARCSISGRYFGDARRGARNSSTHGAATTPRASTPPMEGATRRLLRHRLPPATRELPWRQWRRPGWQTRPRRCQGESPSS
jgi:hypothetical protein